jgi:hypothetical protein
MPSFRTDGPKNLEKPVEILVFFFPRLLYNKVCCSRKHSVAFFSATTFMQRSRIPNMTEEYNTAQTGGVGSNFIHEMIDADIAPAELLPG